LHGEVGLVEFNGTGGSKQVGGGVIRIGGDGLLQDLERLLRMVRAECRKGLIVRWGRRAGSRRGRSRLLRDHGRCGHGRAEYQRE
jgi:hypothetical protein